MEGIYSITMDEERIGSLKVSREGAYTVFEADCDMLPGLIRLSVYGQDKEGYLGVPAPVEGRLRLKKKLSPAGMQDFPREIEAVSMAGGLVRMEKPEPKPEPEPEKSCGEEEKPCEKEKKPCEDDCREDGPFWYASPDGALVSFDKGREMVALPLGDGRVPRNIPGESRVIEGKEYLVYITKELPD